MVSTIRYSANASSDHHPNQVPGILIIMNPKQPNLPTCSVTSTYLLFHVLSNPSLHLIANTTLGIIMTAIKISPKTLNHSILSTITNFDFLNSPNWKLLIAVSEQRSVLRRPFHRFLRNRKSDTSDGQLHYRVHMIANSIPLLHKA